jgi:monoterpene epsilon-lactone hydrolase
MTDPAQKTQDLDLDPDAFQRYLRDNAPGPETLEETRARLDRRADLLPIPTDCEVNVSTVGGVETEILTPVGARRDRAVIYFHGGGYRVGSPRSHRYIAARLADAAGAVGLTPHYRKAPEAPFPGAVEDAILVYEAALKDDSAGRVVFAGDSAGAGLALALAIAARDHGLPQPAGLVLVSPWIDLAHEGATYDANAHWDTVSLEALTALARDYAGGRDLKDPLISPLYGDLHGIAPMLIQVGSREMLLDDSLRLAARAATAHLDVTLKVYPDMVHSFTAHFLRLAGARRALADAGAWVKERLG